MNRRKLLTWAIILGLLLGTGVFAYAQGVDGVTAPPAPDRAEEGTGEIPTEPFETENHAGEAAEKTAAPDAAETPDQPTAAPSEETDTAESEPVVILDAQQTAEAPAPAENAQTAEPTEAPAAYISPYIHAPAGTCLYRDRERTVKLGELLSGAVMLAQRDTVYENGSVLCRVYFVTERSLKSGSAESAYIYSSSLNSLDEEQTGAYLNAAAAFRVDKKPVFSADVRYYEDLEEAAGDPNASRVSRSDVNMRSAPSTQSECLAVLQAGENIEVRARVAGSEGELWYAVTYQGIEGYIRADLVAAIGEIPEMRYENGALLPAAEQTAEPTAELTTEPTIEPTTEPAAEPTAEPSAEQRITVSMACDTETLQLGSRITLTAVLEGYEGLDYSCCWQYAAADSAGNITGEWQDAQADALSFSYTLSESNLLTAWRMCVTVNGR